MSEKKNLLYIEIIIRAIRLNIISDVKSSSIFIKNVFENIMGVCVYSFFPVDRIYRQCGKTVIDIQFIYIIYTYTYI